MRGNNTLVLCELQMQAIVQEWLRRIMVREPPVVKSVKVSGHSFEILLSEPEPTSPPVNESEEPKP